MTPRRSKREIAEGLEDLEDEDAGTLDGEDMYAWIQAIADEGSDVERPPEFYPDGVEWSEELLDMRDTAAERFPAFKHLSPPEVYVLSYMDEDTAEALIELLATSEDPAAREWRQAVAEAGAE